MTLVVDHLGDIAGPGMSRTIWSRDGQGLLEIVRNNDKGLWLFDDFAPFSASTVSGAAPWMATQATAGSVKPSNAAQVQGGWARMETDATATDNGVQMQLGNGGCISPVAASVEAILFECKVRLEVNPTAMQFFAGLSPVSGTVINTGAIAPNNLLGFFMDAATVASDPGKAHFRSRSSASVDTDVTNVHTFVTGTPVKLGFVFIPGSKIEIYVNGVKNATEILTNMPSDAGTDMTPTFVCQNEGTVGAESVAEIDWMACLMVGRTDE